MPAQQGLRRTGVVGSLAAVLGLVIPLVGSPARVEAEKPKEPPYFAITDARIVTGAGQTIEKGTIVLSKGLIAEIGTTVTIPAEAWIIDGSRLTVYPGLIDALGDLGLKEEGPPARTPVEPVPTSGGDETERNRYASWPRGPTPDHDMGSARPTSSRPETNVSRAGATAVLPQPFRRRATEFCPGKPPSSTSQQKEPKTWSSRRRPPSRSSLESSGGGRSFPGSLFGIMAYIKQVFCRCRPLPSGLVRL